MSSSSTQVLVVHGVRHLLHSRHWSQILRGHTFSFKNGERIVIILRCFCYLASGPSNLLGVTSPSATFHQPLGGDKETNPLSEKQLVSSAQIYFILLK